MTLLYLSCLLLGALGALFIIYRGHMLGLVDTPNQRSSHTVPTPKGGGVGILAAFATISLLTSLPLVFAIAVLFVALLGLYGDRIDLTPRFRLTVQFVALLTVITGVTIQGGLGTVEQILLIPLWLVFVVGTANFYNFMDGINGIAGITGVVAFLLLAIFLQLQGSSLYIPLCLGLACSCLGFLPFNIPQARVFMGDVGALLLGAVFGLLVFIHAHTLLDFLCLISFLFPFYIDELSTMYVRLKDGESLTTAHRRHLYQLLVNEKGVPHWLVSLAFGAVQLIVGSTVLGLRTHGPVVIATALLLFSATFLIVSFSVRKST